MGDFNVLIIEDDKVSSAIASAARATVKYIERLRHKAFEKLSSMNLSVVFPSYQLEPSNSGGMLS